MGERACGVEALQGITLFSWMSKTKRGHAYWERIYQTWWECINDKKLKLHLGLPKFIFFFFSRPFFIPLPHSILQQTKLTSNKSNDSKKISSWNMCVYLKIWKEINEKEERNISKKVKRKMWLLRKPMRETKNSNN